MLVNNDQLNMQVKKTLRIWERPMLKKYLIKPPNTRIIVHISAIAASKR
jgi:hypothetical protein